MTTKVDFINDLAAATGKSKNDVAEVIGALFASIIKDLANGEEAVLPGIGKLVPVTRAARTGRNPKTGESIQIAEKPTVKFRPLAKLKDVLK